MAARTLVLSVLLFLTVAGARPSPTDFIKTSCKSTLYPALCEECLASYGQTIRNSPRGLALAALSVALTRTRQASENVSRLSSSSRAVPSRQAGAVKDCVETMGDSVDRIRRSITEMNDMGRAGSDGYALHVSNVQTWVSAALTDENTCLDGLRDSNVDSSTRSALRREIVKVAQVTSNALAFVSKISRKQP